VRRKTLTFVVNLKNIVKSMVIGSTVIFGCILAGRAVSANMGVKDFNEKAVVHIITTADYKKADNSFLKNTFAPFFDDVLNREVLAQQVSLLKFIQPFQERVYAEQENRTIEEQEDQAEIASQSVSKNVTSKDVFDIKNETKYTPDYQSLLQKPLSFGSDAEVLVMHTHTTESYLPDDRNHDPDKNIVKVGEAITKTLNDNGIKAYHNTTVHDYPSFNGSYTKAMSTIQAELQKNPNIKIVIDVHRDGLTYNDGKKLRLATEINGKQSAQVMLVMGTNEGGLEHPNWQDNLSFGLKIQQELLKINSSFARPLNLRRERFNESATPGSMIVEVGANGNTLEEAVTAGEYFAKGLVSVLKK